MNRFLPVLLVAVFTFLLVFVVLYLSRGEVGDGELGGGEDSSRLTADTDDPWNSFEPRRLAAKEVEIIDEPAPVGPAAEGRGSLAIKVQLANGQVPSELRYILASLEGERQSMERTRSGLLAPELDPGVYQCSLYGGDLIPVMRRGIEIKAGKRTVLSFGMARGIQPKGRLLTAYEKDPVAGATIDFGGLAKVTTDELGRFEVRHLVPRQALKMIRITGAQLDNQTYRGLKIPDPSSMTLYLGGGPGVIVGEVVNASGRPVPDAFTVKVTIPPLFETRRELEVSGRKVFRIENLYTTDYRVELHFPNGEFPTIRQFVKIPPDSPDVNVRFMLTAGATMRGRFIGPDQVLHGLRIELRNKRNEVMAQAVPDDELRYRIDGLAPGRYYPYVKTGSHGGFMPEIDVEAEETIVRDIDVLRRKFITD